MRHGYTWKQIADHLHLNYTTVSKAVKELRKISFNPINSYALFRNTDSSWQYCLFRNDGGEPSFRIRKGLE